MLLWFNKLILAGSVFLAAAIALSVYVVTGHAVQGDLGGASSARSSPRGWSCVWYVLPLGQRRSRLLD